MPEQPLKPNIEATADTNQEVSQLSDTQETTLEATEPTKEELLREAEEINTLRQEFSAEIKKGIADKDTEKAHKLGKELKKRIEALQKKLWPFNRFEGGVNRETFETQYNNTIEGYTEFGWLKTLSTGEQGIKDEEGNEYSVPSMSAVKERLMSKRDIVMESLATMENPRIHLVPFALSPERMKDSFSELIEQHFVEDHIEGDTRIPNPTKTKLFGINGDPLKLRVDRENVFFFDDLKNIEYFPKWQKEGTKVKPSGGITKTKAIAQIGGWSIVIIEDIPKAPKKGEGKTITKDIKIKGKTVTVSKTQIEGGLDVAQQYELAQAQNQTGLTLEDYLSYTMLHLRETNTVLDDDRDTDYWCVLSGSNTASGYVPVAFWFRDGRRASLSCDDPNSSGADSGSRFEVRI